MKHAFLLTLLFITSFVLKAQDVTPPVAICKDATIEIGEFGFIEVYPEDVDNGSYDEESGIAFLELSIFEVSCDQIWEENIVTLTVTDNEGNSSSCDALITVADNTPPHEVYCLDVIVEITEGNNVTIESWELEAGSSDNCGIGYSEATKTEFTCEDLGDNIVDVTFYDFSGNSASCQSIVTVQDNRPTDAVCLFGSINVVLESGIGSISLQDINEGYSTCNIVSSELSQSEFTCVDAGVVEVILTVTDVNDNVSTCATDVYVIDNESSVEAICQDVTIQLVDDAATISFEDIDGGSVSTCGFEVNISQTVFGLEHVGENIVTLTLTDPSENVSSCDAIVTVENSDIPPVAVCQNILVELDAEGNASISPEEVDGGSEAGNGFDHFELSQDAFDCSHVGDNLVTLTIFDVNGNSASCDARVIVQDNTAPEAICKSVTVVLEDGYATVSAADVDDNSTDACGIASLEVPEVSFGCENIGAQEVVLTVTDIHGNESSCIATVEVAGSIPEVYIEEGRLPEFCQGDFIVLNAVSSEEDVTYDWSADESSRLIVSNGDLPRNAYVYQSGTYRVAVTNQNGCSQDATIDVAFTREALTSSYTIVASKTVSLKKNTVNSGGIGVLDSKGSVTLESNTTVNGANTFVKSPKTTLKSGSTVATNLPGVAFIMLPPFVSNPYSTSNNDVTVPDNAVVTLSQSIFGKLTIGKNAKVLFTSPDLYIKEYWAKDGSQVSFAACTKMSVAKKLILNKRTLTNPDQQKLVIYNESTGPGNEFEIGENSTFNGSVFLSAGEMKVLASRAEKPTTMNGQFIVGSLDADDYVNWNLSTNCDASCAPASSTEARISAPVTEETDKVIVKNEIESIVAPNPFNQATTIRFIVPEDGKAKLNVFGSTGQVIATLFDGDATAGVQYTVNFEASTLAPGIYFYKVETENGKVQVNKLILTR